MTELQQSPQLKLIELAREFSDKYDIPMDVVLDFETAVLNAGVLTSYGKSPKNDV
jgi:hypothetical protein